jgi:error-prone DNA polymerase
MVDGMLAKGYEREFAERCFHQIEGFGEYGFPESHAASFALLVYASAWLKCHYPDVFAAALLNAQPMGFYAPAQIVRDAREHGVEVRAVDINHSDWDALLEPGARAAGRVHALHHEMAGDILTTHGMRLGFREIKGLKENDARLIVAQRAAGYDSVRDVWLRTMLAPRVIERLADAAAFGSLGLTRREALWAAKALGRVGDREDDLPLFRSSAKISASILSCSAKAEHPVTTEMADEARTLDPSRAVDTGLPACAGNDSERWHQEPDVYLPPMPLGEEVVNDYRFLRLSLRAHPAAFLRADLAQRRIVTNETLRAQKSGTRVAISGLVTCRQRPGSAKGVIFMTIEDETAFANVIVWPATFERFRPIVLGARYVAVTGRMQEECGVIHVVADRLEDLTSLLARLADGPAVEALARCDEVRRPTDDQREKRAAGGRSRLLSLLTDMPELASDLDVPARGSAHAPNRRTLPKT